ncbi:hypothetical protein [Chamaesiphon sp.]|uniref:hypothetical protein n=1 Tax=Chamaesiphon sp. TaxID=2814140 RepID=UPI0035940942
MSIHATFNPYFTHTSIDRDKEIKLRLNWGILRGVNRIKVNQGVRVGKVYPIG